MRGHNFEFGAEEASHFVTTSQNAFRKINASQNRQGNFGAGVGEAMGASDIRKTHFIFGKENGPQQSVSKKDFASKNQGGT